jgi:hypothetical protein
MGFGLMIGFIGPCDTAHEYTLQFTVTHTRARTHTHTHTHTHTPCVRGHVLTDIAWLRLPTADVPLPLCFPKWSPASATSLLQQQFTAAELQQSPN